MEDGMEKGYLIDGFCERMRGKVEMRVTLVFPERRYRYVKLQGCKCDRETNDCPDPCPEKDRAVEKAKTIWLSE